MFNNTNTTEMFFKSIIFGISILAITGCGNSNSETTNSNVKTKILSGFVVDDPIAGADIKIYDINGSLLNTNIITTDKSGKYKTETKNEDFYIIKSSNGTINGNKFTGKLYAIVKNNTQNANLTPLTTIIYEMIKNDTRNINIEEKITQAIDKLTKATGINAQDISNINLNSIPKFDADNFRKMVSQNGFDKTIEIIANDAQDGTIDNNITADVFEENLPQENTALSQTTNTQPPADISNEKNPPTNTNYNYVPSTYYTPSTNTDTEEETNKNTSSETNESENVILSARFADAPVEGIYYSSETSNGTTDYNGTFQYSSADKEINFSVGSILIGKISTSDIKNGLVLPADLFGLDRNNTTDEKILKVIEFLQSLDEDSNINNGIQISSDTVNLINNETDINPDINPNLTENNISIIKEIINSADKKLILENTARNNYKKYLESIGIVPDKMPFTMIFLNTDHVEISINNSFAGEYNFTVKWGDGNVTKDANDTVSHDYNSSGDYTVKISGKFPAIESSASPYPDYFSPPNSIIVTHWGDIKWKSFNNAFSGENLNVTSNDIPDLSEVTDMSNAFSGNYNTINLYINNINQWNVSHVSNLSGVFSNSNFNQDISSWDVSNVINMSGMFSNDYDFNQSLSEWNVSNVTDMKSMFEGAANFNQNINAWNVSHVTDMSSMFCGARNFNQPLGEWNVSNVTDMNNMFDAAENFNQNIENWNVSHVTNMASMFVGAKNFNQPLAEWNVTNVTKMRYMFNSTKNFDQNISDWNVSNVTDMSYMFAYSVFNHELKKWNVKNVQNMNGMFYKASEFYQNIHDWNVSNVTEHNDFATDAPIENNKSMLPVF